MKKALASMSSRVIHGEIQFINVQDTSTTLKTSSSQHSGVLLPEQAGVLLPPLPPLPPFLAGSGAALTMAAVKSAKAKERNCMVMKVTLSLARG